MKGIRLITIVIALTLGIGAVRMYANSPIQAENIEVVVEDETAEDIDQEEPKETEDIDNEEVKEDEENRDADVEKEDEKEDEKKVSSTKDSKTSDSTKVPNKGTSSQENSHIVIIKEPNDILVLVNKERALPSDYVPSDLVIPNVNFPFTEDLPKKYMREVAARALEELFQKAKEDNIELFATSGYRSYNTQKSIFEANVRRKGEKEANKTSAYPGQSEHQTGLAMDVTSRSVGFGLEESFGDVKEGIWVRENAHKFGFIVRYPKGKERITGYSYEPWHLRYVGKEVAEAITAAGITLEEYLGFKYVNSYMD